MALFGGGPSKKSVKLRKQYARRLEGEAAKLSSRQELIDTTEKRAEEAKLSILGSLGAPGTYGDILDEGINPYTNIGGMQIFDPRGSDAGIFDRTEAEAMQIGSVVSGKIKPKNMPTTKEELLARLKKVGVDGTQFSDEAIARYLESPSTNSFLLKGKHYKKLGIGQDIIDANKPYAEGIVDPTKFSAAFYRTPLGRTMSAQQRIAYEMVEQKGPLYEKIERAITAPIHDGAAQLGRATMIDLRSMAARGGAARRTALQEATKIAAHLETRAVVTESLKDAQLKLFTTGQQFAQAVTAFNVNLIESLPMIGQQHLNAMKTLNQFYATIVAPTTLSYAGQAAKIKLQIEKERQKAKGGLKRFVLGGALGFLGKVTGMNLGTGGKLDPSAMGSAFGSLFGGGNNSVTSNQAGQPYPIPGQA